MSPISLFSVFTALSPANREEFLAKVHAAKVSSNPEIPPAKIRNAELSPMSKRGPRGLSNADYRRALVQTNGNKRLAAVALQVTTPAVYAKCKNYPELLKGLTDSSGYVKVTDKQITAALRKSMGKVTKAARILGCSAQTVTNRINANKAVWPKGMIRRTSELYAMAA